MARQDDYIRTALRLPPDLHKALHESADASGKSFNAEIIARLQASFTPGGHGQLVIRMHSTGSDAQDPNRIGKALEQIPADLSTQYGLHLYNTELKVAQSQLEEARDDFQPLYDKLQRLLEKEDGPPGPKTRASQAVTDIQRRIAELDNQVEVLNQTISNIHLYRKTQGLPELRNVREVAVTVRIGGAESSSDTKSPAK